MSAEDCERLLSWATDRGIELHGIEFRPIPGAGVGMVATKPLKPNERILYVPTSALRTLDTIRPKLKKALPPGTKVQALLAADLALDTPKSKYSPWNALLPSPQDLLTALPLAWFDPSLHRFLPPPALTLLQKQQAKFARDWSAVQPALTTLNRKTITRQGFLHAWLLANTRTFYHTSSSTARLPKDDRMILQPVADLFNHADSGCEVCFDAGSFTVSADRAYVPGEEVYICYGRHPNDFLMVEYGFVLERNRWDEVGLDEVVLEELGGGRESSAGGEGVSGQVRA